MIFKTAVVFTCAILLITQPACQESFRFDATTCSFNGIPLHGKVKVVEHFPDIKVKVVTSFPDLNVQWVKQFPNACGKWQQCDHFPDFTIQYVTDFPDITVQFVEHFPGTRSH